MNKRLFRYYHNDGFIKTIGIVRAEDENEAISILKNVYRLSKIYEDVELEEIGIEFERDSFCELYCGC